MGVRPVDLRCGLSQCNARCIFESGSLLCVAGASIDRAEGSEAAAWLSNDRHMDQCDGGAE